MYYRHNQFISVEIIAGHRALIYISHYIKTINCMKTQQNQIYPDNEGHDKLPLDGNTCPLPRLNIPMGNNHKYRESQPQVFVHTFEEEVTFRKIQPVKHQTESQPSLEHLQNKKSTKHAMNYDEKMSEQKAKSQLLDESDSLRRKQTDEVIEMIGTQARDYHLSEDISGFTLRQINYLKALSVVRSQLKQEQDRKRAIKSNSSDHLQQNLIKRYRTNTVLDRLLGENRDKTKGIHQQIKIFSPYPRSLNIRAQTLQLCKKALLKTKSIDLEVLDSNKSVGSLMTSQIKHNLQFSRRRRSRKSKEIECLHEVQYNKLMKQIQNIQGINQVLVAKSKNQTEGPRRQKIIHNSQQDLKDQSNKRVKYVSRKLKTTLQQHESRQQVKFKVINGFPSKNNCSEDLESHESIQDVSDHKHKKRCNSTIVQGKQSEKNFKRFKIFNIYKNIKQERAKESSQQEKKLQPVTNSISYPLKQRQRPLAEAETQLSSNQMTTEPAIKVNLQIPKNNTKTIINSIKLYSETRKSKNISSLLMQERNRFKMNHLLKQMHSSQARELFQ